MDIRLPGKVYGLEDYRTFLRSVECVFGIRILKSYLTCTVAQMRDTRLHKPVRVP